MRAVIRGCESWPYFIRISRLQQGPPLASAITNIMGCTSVELMPELSLDGRELWLHVFCAENEGEKGKGRSVEV